MNAHRLNHLANRLFGIDARSLAAFRIGMGLLLLGDLAIRASSMGVHYTDDGVLPRTLLIDTWRATGRWSLHMLGGDAASQAVLFLLATAAAVALTLGYRTRLATVACWVLTVSLQHRNPLVCNAADELVAALLLWAIFLPLGRCWSLDAKRQSAPAAQKVDALSLATAAILLQVVVMYLFTGLFKWNELWHDGSALRRALHNDLYARPLGLWLREQTALVTVMAKAVPWFEIVAPLLAFVPIFTGRIRLVLIALFLAFHLGIELTLTTGLFPYASAAAWLLFVPGGVWDRFCNPREAASGKAIKPWPGWAAQALVAVLFGLMVWWNVSAWMGPRPASGPAERWNGLRNALRLDQRWNMFGRPGLRGGWYVIVGTTEDGRATELLTGEPFDPTRADRPGRISAMFPNHRWRKHFSLLTREGYEPYQKALGPALCAWWNQAHDEADRIDRIEVNFIEVTYADSPGEPATIRRLVYYRGVCAKPTDIVMPPPAPEGI